MSWFCMKCGTDHDTSACPNVFTTSPMPVSRRQPFTCPVCSGKGRVWGGYETGTVPQEPCAACSGTGIVWGPPDA